MAITGKLNADFSPFFDAVIKAEKYLTDMSAGADRAGQRLNAMVDKFSGRKIIQEATLMAEAIERSGGVSKLTANELALVGTQASAAADKLRVLGRDVPPGIQKLADATHQVGVSAKSSTSLLAGMAGQLTSMFTVGAVVAFGREVLRAGDTIVKMADQTGLTTEQVQRFQYVAGQSGTSIESLVSAVQNLQQRLGDDNTGAAGAMSKLGINAEAFNKLGTYEQMLLLADALRQVKDPTEFATAGAALFGKTWKEIAPAIKAGMKEIGDQAPLMADSTVKSLDRIGDALTRAKTQVTTFGGSFAIGLEQAGFAAWDFLSIFSPSHFGVANSMLLEMEGHLNDPDGIRGALAKIPPVALAVNESFKGIAMSAADVKKAEDELTAAIARTNEETKLHGELLKQVQSIEADKNSAAMTGLLGLSKAAQESSQRRFEATSQGFDQMKRAEDDYADFVAKSTMDSASYQVRKINETAEAKIASFRGTTDQLAAYSASVRALATAEADAVVAAASKALTVVTEKAVGAARAVQLAIQQVTAGQAVDVQGNMAAAGVAAVSSLRAGFGTGRYVGGVDTWGTGGGASGTPMPASSAPVVYGAGVQSFAKGGVGDFGAGTLAMLHGKEAIVPLDGRGGGMSVTINVNGSVLGNPQQIAAAVGDALMQRMRQLGARFPSGV